MSTQTEAQHYPNHDAEALGQDYINHISAMTTEGLRAKSSIAIQLAWRDVEIRRLEAANTELLEALKGVTDELLDVLYDINNDRIPFDGDEFHERLEAGKAAIKKHGGSA